MEDAWRESGVPDDLGLSEAEKIAIFEYTTDNAFIKEFNRASRDDFGAALETYGGFIATLQSGLSKLKPYQNRVWRGSDPLPPQVMATLTTKGATWSPGQFWSSAWDKKGLARHPKAIVFDIQSKTGKNISDMSANQDEYEVLFQPDARFRVKDYEEVAPGKWEIELTDLGRPDEEG